MIESHLGRQTRVETNQIWLDGDHHHRVQTFLEKQGFGMADTHELPPDLQRSEPDNFDTIAEVRREARMTAETVMISGLCDPEEAASYLVYDDLKTRQAATEALARFGSGPIEPLLYVLEASDDETVCSNALQALAGGVKQIEPQVDPQRISDCLVSFCDYPTPLVRWAAVRALAKFIEYHPDEIDNNTVFEPLVELLNDKPKIRMTAALALGNLGDSRALDPLERLTSRTEPGSENHERALDAIEKISFPD
ncbi:HEAT repeat domain-containing protein [Natrialbaceae archaeon A-CW1-1]